MTDLYLDYKVINIKTASDSESATSILIIYTGGTIGMVYDQFGKLVPFDFKDILKQVPELRRFGFRLTVVESFQPIDSSDMSKDHWLILANIIKDFYDEYDAFVILHGTDTMAYTASALSFLLENLGKPVILTGSQIPIGETRTDGRNNFITALEFAAEKRKNGLPMVPEVCVLFDAVLLRGNRTRKVHTTNFSAFVSENYPKLAKEGIYLSFNENAIKPYPEKLLKVHTHLDNNVVFLKIFPSISQNYVKAILNLPHLRGVVMETYGAGNLPTQAWIYEALKNAIEKGIFIYNVSQCLGGKVVQGRYGTSSILNEIGVISGMDITPEAAITKMMFLLGNEENPAIIRQKLSESIGGEMTI